MLDSKMIKKRVYGFGAVLCGISSADRFEKAPEEFRPGDIYEGAMSVIVFAGRIPVSLLVSKSIVPYTVFEDVILKNVFDISLKLSYLLEDNGFAGVPVPSSPYLFWDEGKKEGRGILSLRHAGYYAGLGFLGKNTLLTNNKYGNMIRLGAVITDLTLESDKIADYNFCGRTCSLCIDNCPAKAIDGIKINQKLCREHSHTDNGKGTEFYSCSLCRSICPHRSGESVFTGAAR